MGDSHHLRPRELTGKHRTMLKLFVLLLVVYHVSAEEATGIEKRQFFGGGRYGGHGHGSSGSSAYSGGKALGGLFGNLLGAKKPTTPKSNNGAYNLGNLLGSFFGGKKTTTTTTTEATTTEATTTEPTTAEPTTTEVTTAEPTTTEPTTAEPTTTEPTTTTKKVKKGKKG